METKKEPVLPASKNKKNIKMGNVIEKVSTYLLTIPVVLLGLCFYDNVHKQIIYDNLNIKFFEVKDIEYGTSNYNPMNLIKEASDGTKTTVKSNVDTSKIGKQEIVFEISKSGVTKEFKLNVEVKDTNVPEVALKTEEVTINEGDELDLTSNIEKVFDTIDGDLTYTKENNTAKSYTVSSDFDSSKPGIYQVTVNAIDSNGNKTETTYKIKVNEKPKTQVITPTTTQETYTNQNASVDTSNVINAAKSLIGTRYQSGGVSPDTGFDCSGFVKYIYSLFGINLSGGSSSQLNAGTAVSEDNLQAGDIIIWANNGSNSASHSSVYAGDGTIIHATTNRGVQQTSLSGWKTWGQHIIGIRRI